MPRLWKKPRSHGVEPSPTPMIGTVGDSRTVISTPRSIRDRASISAVIQPADPPPTMTMRRTAAGPRPGFLPVVGLYEQLKSVAVVMGDPVVWSGSAVGYTLAALPPPIDPKPEGFGTRFRISLATLNSTAPRSCRTRAADPC